MDDADLKWIDELEWAAQNQQLDSVKPINNAIREARGLPQGVEPPYVQHLVAIAVVAAIHIRKLLGKP